MIFIELAHRHFDHKDDDCAYADRGLVSGIASQKSRKAASATPAIPVNPAAWPRLPATWPESVVLRAAPKPDIVPTTPCPKLNRPEPLVTSATVSAVSTPKAVPLMPSRS